MIHTDRQIKYEWLNETHTMEPIQTIHRVVWIVLSYIHFEKDIVYKKVPLNFALGPAGDMFLKN